jgi:hypothetical protein
VRPFSAAEALAALPSEEEELEALAREPVEAAP